MSADPRFVLSNPGLGVFVQQTGRALHEAGILERFATTLVDRPGAVWRPALTGRINAILKKRALTEFPVELASTYATRELLRLFTREVDWTHGVWTDALWEWAEDGFDRWVARRGLAGADAVYGYEHACLRTFQDAKRRGIACYYEVPAPEAGYAQKVRDKEIAAHPELDSPYERRTRALHGRRLEHRRQEWALADRVIASSEFTKSTYAAVGLDVSKVRVVPLGAPPVPPPSEDHADASSPGPLRFLFVGAVALHKGVHHLLAAWRKLRVPPGAASLEFVGRIALPEAALQDCPPSVKFEGRLSSAEIFARYRQADVLVFPALCDGFGMVVTEALSQGLPVITTTCAGAGELIRDGVNGWIVPPADPGALAAAMDRCLTHRAELKDMRAAARATAAAWQWSDYRRRLIAEILPLPRRD